MIFTVFYCAFITAGAPGRSPPLWDFSYPPIPSSSPGRGRGQPAPCSPPAGSPTVRTWSKIVKEPWWSSLQMPRTSWVWAMSDPCEEWHELFWSTRYGPERVSWHSHQSFSTLVAILAMEAFALRFLWSAAAHFPSFVFWWSLIWNFLKRFLTVVSNCMKSPLWRMGGGKEKDGLHNWLLHSVQYSWDWVGMGEGTYRYGLF